MRVRTDRRGERTAEDLVNWILKATRTTNHPPSGTKQLREWRDCFFDSDTEKGDYSESTVQFVSFLLS